MINPVRDRLRAWIKKYGFHKEAEIGELLNAVLSWHDDELKREKINEQD